MSPPFIPFWQRIFFSMAYGTMIWISLERIQPKHRKQEGTFLEGPMAILSGAVAQGKLVNWRWSGRPQISRGPVEDGRDGTNFQFAFHSHGVKFRHLMVEMVELLFLWVVQISSVFKSFFICSSKAGTSIKTTDMYCPSFWHHSTKIRRCRRGARCISNQSEWEKWWLSDSPQWNFCFSVLKDKVCVCGSMFLSILEAFDELHCTRLQQGHCTHDVQADVTSKHWTNFTRSGCVFHASTSYRSKLDC